MSALGSSVINKSGKKFAPKAPARRTAALTSAHASARPSVDRQLKSQTPQPQIAQQRTAPSPAPSIRVPLPGPTPQPDSAPKELSYAPENAAVPTPSQDKPALAATPRNGGSTSIPIPPPTKSRPEFAIPYSKPQEKPTSPPRQFLNTTGGSSTVASSASDASRNQDLTQDSSDPVHLNSSSAPTALTSDHVDHIRLPVDASTVKTRKDQQATKDDLQGRAPKRRRVGESQSEEEAAIRSFASGSNADIPIPSTELNRAVAGPSGSDSVSSQTARAEDPKQSITAKRKQDAEKPALDRTTGGRHGPSARTKNSKKNTGRGTHSQENAGFSNASLDLPQNRTDAVGPKASQKQARRKATKQLPKQTIEEAAAQVVEEAVQGSSKDSKRRKARARRVATPEGAEKEVISPSITTMSDLCTDPHTGRRSSLDARIDKHLRAEFVRKKQEQLQEIMGRAEPEDEAGVAETAEAREQRLASRREEEEAVAHAVPEITLVNGQIQIDEGSLHIDRHKDAAVEREAEQLNTVTEDDLTRKINSGSFVKRDKSGGWNELLTDRFYQGLRMFGTDFGMISKMFPGRTRHKIKLKFVKEEKWNYDKIRATLLGEHLPVNLPELERMAGTEFDDPMELERDMEEDRKRLEEETLAEKEAMEDARREREAEIQAERAAADGESSSKENRRAKHKKTKGEKRKRKEGASKKKRKHVNDTVEVGQSEGP